MATRRSARSPWHEALHRLRARVTEHHLLMFAPSFAFHSFLTVFPAIATLLAVYGLIFDLSAIERAFQALRGVLSDEAITLIRQQVKVFSRYSRSGLGVSLLVAFLLTLWSASNAIKTLMAGLNAVHGWSERRSFFRLNTTALWMAFASILFAAVALALIAALPILLKTLSLKPTATLVGLFRWPMLAGSMMLALAVLYRFAPYQPAAAWRWVSVGAALATALWLAGSVVFSVYVTHFGAYNKVYGTLGAIAMLLVWFYLSGLAVLLGAEANGLIERRAGRRPGGALLARERA